METVWQTRKMRMMMETVFLMVMRMMTRMVSNNIFLTGAFFSATANSSFLFMPKLFKNKEWLHFYIYVCIFLPLYLSLYHLFCVCRYWEWWGSWWWWRRNPGWEWWTVNKISDQFVIMSIKYKQLIKILNF